MFPFDIYCARARYDEMLAEAEERRLAKASQSITRRALRPLSDVPFIARLIDALRPRRAARAN